MSRARADHGVRAVSWWFELPYATSKHKVQHEYQCSEDDESHFLQGRPAQHQVHSDLQRSTDV